MEHAGDEPTEGPLTAEEKDLLRESGLYLADLAAIQPSEVQTAVESGQWALLPATPYDTSAWVVTDQPNA